MPGGPTPDTCQQERWQTTLRPTTTKRYRTTTDLTRRFGNTSRSTAPRHTDTTTPRSESAATADSASGGTAHERRSDHLLLPGVRRGCLRDALGRDTFGGGLHRERAYGGPGMTCDCPLRGDSDPSAERCHEPGPRETICTRPAGHDGPHAACSVAEHPVVTWEESA